MRAFRGRDRLRAWMNLLALGGGALFAEQAAAQSCTADADCGDGYRCQIETIGACSKPACAPGQVCPPPTCQEYTYGSCVSKPCSADADCPAAMLCNMQTYQECDDYPTAPPQDACAPDQVPCPVSPEPPKPTTPPSCRTYTKSACAEPWELPCTVDADCGGGFRCIEEISHWCQGSGSIDRDGGVTQSETVCGEERTGHYYCQLQELPCDADSACPSGLLCRDNPVRNAGCVSTDPGDAADAPAPSRGPSAARDGGVSAPADEPAVSSEAPTTTPPSGCPELPALPAKVCQPRNYGGYPGGGYPPRPGDSVGGSSGNGSSTGEDSPPDDDEAEAPTTPPRADAGAAKPTTGKGTGRRSVRKVIERIRDVHGCSLIEGTAGGSDLSWLAIAGVLGAVSRRRKQSAA